MNTINILYSSQKQAMATLMEEHNQQDIKIKQLEMTCDHQLTTIQQLNDTVLKQKASIINLEAKLQEKDKLLNAWSDNSMNGHSYETEHLLHFNNMSPSSSQDSVTSNDNFECGPPPILITNSNECSDTVQEQRLSPNMV